MKKLTKAEKKASMKENELFRMNLKRLFNDCDMFEKKPARRLLVNSNYKGRGI